MTKIIRVLFLILLMLTEKTFAYIPREGQVTATLGPYFSRTDYHGDDAAANPSSYHSGVGLVAVGDINSRSSLEIALLYAPVLYIRSQDSLYLTEKTQMMHITMGWRYWFNPYFSGSLSFFSAYSMGNSTITYTALPPGQTLNTSATDVTEYGFDFALQGDLWHNEKFAVILETRYSLSVTNKRAESGNQYGALLGLRYLIQEGKDKEVPPPSTP